MTDPFANYDAWLEKPYRDREREAEREEAAWAHFDLEPSDLEPPHAPGGHCPLCGEHQGLAVTQDEMGLLYCQSCDRDVDPMQAPVFDPVQVLDEEAADARISAAEDARAGW